MRGWSAYSMVRTVDGIPVVDREVRLILDAQRRPAYLLGLRRASHPTPGATRVSGLALNPDGLPNSHLVYWPKDDRAVLAREVHSVFGDGQDPAGRHYVDTHSGHILDRLPTAYGARARKVYDFESACRSERVGALMGEPQSHRLVTIAVGRHLVREEGSGPSGRDQIDAVFDLLGELYEFLAKALEMDSVDDQGAPLQSVANVRFSLPNPSIPQCVGEEFNAFWVDSLRTAVLPTGIVNYPEVAILGVHKIAPRPVVRSGRIVIREIMHLSLSQDHRVVDGAVGARFLQDVIARLESPETGI